MISAHRKLRDIEIDPLDILATEAKPIPFEKNCFLDSQLQLIPKKLGINCDGGIICIQTGAFVGAAFH